MLVAIAPLVITLAAPAAIAQPAPSEAFQRATLEGLSPETRAKVERRATGGNSVYEVAMQLANLVKPGEPPLSSVVAIDFIRAGFWMLRRHGSSSLPATLGRHPSSPCTAADAESPTVRVLTLTLLKAWVPGRLRDGLAIYDQRTLEGCPCLCRQSLADKEKADERFGSEPR